MKIKAVVKIIIRSWWDMVMQVLQKTQTIVRYQNQNSKDITELLKNGEILQLSSNFNEIVDNELKFDGDKS